MSCCILIWFPNCARRCQGQLTSLWHQRKRMVWRNGTLFTFVNYVDTWLCRPLTWTKVMSVPGSQPISCKPHLYTVQLVPARVEDPIKASSGGLVVSRTIHPFPRCPKPAWESRLSKLAFWCQCVFRRRRRTRLTWPGRSGVCLKSFVSLSKFTTFLQLQNKC